MRSAFLAMPLVAACELAYVHGQWVVATLCAGAVLYLFGVFLAITLPDPTSPPDATSGPDC